MAPDAAGGLETPERRKVLFMMQITPNLDPNLKYYLNSLKRSLLMSKTSLRLIIIEGEKVIAGQDEDGRRVEGAMGPYVHQVTDLVHFLTPFQQDEQLRFLMNGTLTISNKLALNMEILQNLREKNMYVFGSTRQKLCAYTNFLKIQRDEDLLRQSKAAHIPPALVQVYQFLLREQDKCPGFKYVLTEIFGKQVKNADNLKLTAMLTMDFDEYLRCATRAQDQFFQDRIARSASMASLGPKGLQSAARAKETGGPPDLRELQGSGSRRFLDQTAP